MHARVQARTASGGGFDRSPLGHPGFNPTKPNAWSGMVVRRSVWGHAFPLSTGRATEWASFLHIIIFSQGAVVAGMPSASRLLAPTIAGCYVDFTFVHVKHRNSMGSSVGVSEPLADRTVPRKDVFCRCCNFVLDFISVCVNVFRAMKRSGIANRPRGPNPLRSHNRAGPKITYQSGRSSPRRMRRAK